MTNSLLDVPAVSRRMLAGKQRPRVSVVPDFETSAGQEAVELARLAGLELDEWEQFVLQQALGERPDGRWSAFEVGLVVPRQNGKGTILEARELAGLFLFGEQLLIHSAHEQATASEHFRRLLMLIESVPEFDRRVLKAPKGKGSEAIELRNGQRIFFKTRTGGGGRGLTGDLVVLDEAMILPVATTAALVPTMAARSMTGNPQLWYAGSAVDQLKTVDGIVLARLRARALDGASKKLAYFEWSAPGDDPEAFTSSDLGERELWEQANPGLGIRISQEHIENEWSGALGPREFAVERLGIGDWPAVGASSSMIDLDVWDSLEDRISRIDGAPAFAFDVSPDRSHAAVAAAGRNAAGFGHVEVVEHTRGTGWLVDYLTERCRRHHPSAVVCDGSGPAGSLIHDLEQAGVTVTAVTSREHGQACGQLFDAVQEGRLRHLGTAEIRAAIRGASTRPLGDAWAWSRKSSSTDITPLVASTLAYWAHQNTAAPFAAAW